MGCAELVFASEFKKPSKTYDKTTQSCLIEFILKHSQYDLHDLAELINSNVSELNSVLIAQKSLSSKQSSDLYGWFLVLIGKY